MATNITIPQVTLPVGQSTFGPANMNKERTLVLTLDRTVAGGLNSLTSATTLEVAVNTSVDGTAFNNEASFTTVGGILSDRHGQINSNVLTIVGLGGQGTKVEIVTIVGGTFSVVVDGSIALT